jgi:pyrimidine-nucleoside phosphorylase
MRALDLIRKKRDGHELTREEIRFLIEGYVREGIPDYQMAAFCMAVYFRDMSEPEMLHLTEAMRDSGETLSFPNMQGFIVDKHSTGGVGDKVSLVLVPLVAAAGLYIGKLSGRGLGHTGGTIDKLESIPGFSAQLGLDEFRGLVERHGAAIAESGEELAPADHKLYALRDVTATVESIPLIVASILGKKLAVRSHGIVFDVKTGAGAILPRFSQTKRLARLLVEIARRAGRRAAALLTDMSQPLGLTVGNALEVREAIETLRGGGPHDLEEICVALGGELLLMSGEARTPDRARRKLRKLLRDGRAFERFLDVVRAQGGDARAVEAPRLPRARGRVPVLAPRSGYVTRAHARLIGEAAHLLGAGRSRKGEPIDPAVGVEVLKKIGDPVERGEPLCSLHVNRQDAVEIALRRVRSAYRIGRAPVEPPALLRGRIA